MRQYPLDELRILDAGDHLEPPAAAGALLDLDGEYPLGGNSVNQIAGELGISQTSLSRWKRQAEAAGSGSEVFAAEAELRRLRRENERLKMERDILKKATAFFARESE
jgi:transposase